MPPKGGGIETQGLDFVLGVVDDATPGLKKFDAALDSSAVHAERAGERVASAQKAAAEAVRAACDDMSDDLDDFWTKGVKSLDDITEHFNDFGDDAQDTVERLGAKMEQFGQKGSAAGDAFHKMAGLTKLDFIGLGKQVMSLDQILGSHFKTTGKQNDLFTKAFLQQNERVIREAIKNWKDLGRVVPAELQKAEKALDSFDAKAKSKFMRVEDLVTKIKGLSVSNTVVGALAVGAISKGQEYAEEGFRAANPAAKTEMGGEKMVQGRRKDITTLAQTTGASFDELKDINKEFSQMAYLGPKSFKETAEAALQLSRTTTMGVGDAAKLTDTLQQRFGMTKDQIKETEESIALLSKTSGASADAIGEIYDELKFLKFGMEGNADAAGRLAKNTASAAAEMSKYGLDSKTAISDVKSVLHGGISEYQQNMKTMILGGATPEQATKMLDDVAEGVAGATEKMEKFKGQAAGNMRVLGGKGALGRAMGTEIGGKALKMDSEEMDKRAAYARGDIKTPELTAEQKKTANEEVLSGGQRRERTENRGKGLGAQMAGQTYDVARSLAEVVDKQAEGLAKFSEASPLFSTAVSIFGTAANVFAAAVAVNSGIETAKGLGILKGGAGLAGKAAGAAAGTGGTASGLAGPGLGAAAAGAAVVYGGAAAVGIIANRRIKSKADDIDAQASLDSSKKSAADLNVMKKKIEEAHAAGDWDKEYRARTSFQKLFGGQGAAVMPPKPELGAATPMTVTPLRSSASAESSAAPTAATAAGAAPAGAPQNGPAEQEKPAAGAYTKDLGGLVSLAEAQKFRVTSTTGDAHNKGSLHYQGKAIDVSVRGKKSSDIDAFKMAASASGFKVRDEQTKPAGQAVWSAPHLHMEIPGGATASAAMVKKPSASPAGPASKAVASPTGPSATADTSGASASVQGKGMTEAAAAPAVAAASQEPFTGSTDGDKNVISELRKTNSILARIAATSSRPGDARRPPNPAMMEMNQGGNG